MPIVTSQTTFEVFQLFGSEVLSNVLRCRKIYLCCIVKIERFEKLFSMHQDRDPPCERNVSRKKSEESNLKSLTEDSSQKEMFDNSVDRQLEESMRLSKFSPEEMGVSKQVPSLGRADDRTVLPIPVNEMKKAGQKPRRILPHLPPVVQELLRWSIHPQQVLRGAASVSHLFTLPAIEEETLPIVHLTEITMEPRVPIEKRSLPSIPSTDNRALPSKDPSTEGKSLSKSKNNFRRRMLPTLPTIKEQTSPTLTESTPIPPEEKENPSLKREREELQSLKDTVRKERRASPQATREISTVPDDRPKVRRAHPRTLLAGNNALTEERPCVRAKLARSGKTIFEPSERRALHSYPVNTKPVLPEITKKELLAPRPPSTPKTTVSRRPHLKILPMVNRSTPNNQPLQQPITQKPQSLHNPTAKRKQPKIQEPVNRPLPSIQLAQEAITPKPPSSSKPIFTRSRVTILATGKRQSKGIQVDEKQTHSNLRLPNLQRLVKQPLSSVQLEENCLSADDTKQTVKANSKPSLMKRQRGSKKHA